jgi:hypothetical protein
LIPIFTGYIFQPIIVFRLFQNMSDATTTTTTTKKFSLPAKHSKFIQYGYFLINQLATANPSIDTQSLLSHIHTFDEPIAQHAFVESFLSQSDDIATTLKNINKNNRAALKLSTSKPKTSKPKTSKNKSAVVQDDLVAELVALAKSTNISDETITISPKTPTQPEPNPQPQPQPQPPTQPNPKPKETKPKETKPKETKSKETKPKETKSKETKPKETKSKETKSKETKPKETKSKETKPKETKSKANKTTIKPLSTPEPTATTSIRDGAAEPDTSLPSPPDNRLNTTTDDVELTVSIFKFNDKTFLIDDSLHVYDFQTHLPLGIFDKNQNDIIPTSFIL